MKMWETAGFFFVSIILIIYFGLKYRYNYWKRKNIPHVPSHIFDFEWFTSDTVTYYTKIYRQLKGHRFGGLYAKFTPKLMILDPKLITHILIKDFANFQDRSDVVFDENEPLTTHLFSAPGPLWKSLRTKLTPMFAVKKLKNVWFDVADECAKELNHAIGKHIEINDTIDVKDFNFRCVIEIIAKCTFGVKAHAIQNENSIFKEVAKNIFAPNFSAKLILLTQSAIPSLKKTLGISLTHANIAEFFHKFTEDMLKQRNSDGVDRDDFLQTLINLRDEDKQNEMKSNQSKYAITDEMLASHCFLFFLSGYENVTLTTSLALYELAANTDIQKNLQNEIDENLQKYDNKITYEMLNNMPYLNKVVLETMRKYTHSGTFGRICASRYKIPDSEVFIEKGTEVLIPIAGLHSDPEYFLNPGRFYPERFNDANIFPPNVFMPFGVGPRNCIAGKFGKQMVKSIIVHLCRDFNFEMCSMTPYPLEFKPFKHPIVLKSRLFLKCTKK